MSCLIKCVGNIFLTCNSVWKHSFVYLSYIESLGFGVLLDDLAFTAADDDYTLKAISPIPKVETQL